MFKLHDFVMKTLNGMRDHYPEFQIRQYALNWYAKAALTEEDLMEIEGWFTPAMAEEEECDPETDGGEDDDN